MNLFDTYYDQYKKLPFECKPITHWLEMVGDHIQNGRISDLSNNQIYKLSIVMRHADTTCRECTCPKKE
jgi:hypothetical protein